MTDIAEGPPSPYVGPRAFREGERLYGRERQKHGLVNTLISGRVVLLHAPSGAGKTSLIQSEVAPAMAERGFQLCARHVPRFSALRVNAPVPVGLPVANRYVYSVVCDLLRDVVPKTEDLRDCTIDDALRELADRGEPGARQLLIFDQFEEILTLDPTDQEGQRTFFEQVGDALDQPGRWALFAMREDYMGGLDRFRLYVPGQLRSTFRLDLLEVAAARSAIALPAKQYGVEFEDAAAHRLVSELAKVPVESPDAGVHMVDGNLVEPVLLQVVCDNLWRSLSGPGFERITQEDVRDNAHVDDALSEYYARAVRFAARKDLPTEGAIRDWVEEKLLTEQQFRGQTRSRPAVDDGEDVMRRLQRRYLVREDPRGNAVWWELSHDRLIGPVVESNRRWRDEHLEEWQRRARRWRLSQQDAHLLTAAELRQANGSRRGLRIPETAPETAFLELSGERAMKDGRVTRLRAQLSGLGAALAVSVLLNVLALIYVMHA